jgi:DNA-directed RNA polymerase specialized sigma24 family protein
MNVMTTAQTSKTTEDMIARACYAKRDMISKIARGYGLGEDAADDLIQEVVIYIISYHRQYGLDISAPKKFTSLVRRSAIQRALNVVRHKKLRGSEAQMPDFFEAVCSDELPDECLEAELRLERAFAVTQDCRVDQLELLLAGYCSLLIAELQGISKNTSYSRTRYIRKSIEKEFEHG